MSIIDRATRIADNVALLYGHLDQTTTPVDIIDDMINEVPRKLMETCVVRDLYCGRGSILIRAAIKKMHLMFVEDEDENQKILYRIVREQLSGNDIDPSYAGLARSTLMRLTKNNTGINIDNIDALIYNTTMTVSNTISITNPPYQPPRGVKKGGNYYKEHVMKELRDCPKFGVTNIPMTFMVQDPYDNENEVFRHALLEAGLKKIKHVRSDAYAANVLTVFVVWEGGYTGPVEFLTYDIDINASSTYHSISLPRQDLYKMRIWPVARTMAEVELATKIMECAKKKYSSIKGKPSLKKDWCVEYEYLIGMEKERLNRKNPLRGVAKRGPNDSVRGGSLSKFINVKSEEEADSLVAFLNDTGQAWFRLIPRGSSAENWMVGPLVELWDKSKRVFTWI